MKAKSHHLPRILLIFLLCSGSFYKVAFRWLLIPDAFANVGWKTGNSTSSPFLFPIQLPRPKRVNGTLYLCGWESGRLAQHLFDDFLPAPAHDAEVATLTNFSDTMSLDVLVFGGGYCCDTKAMNLTWLQNHFRGTILYVNGESYADEGSTANHSFMISSQETTANNMYVPYAAMALVGMVPPNLWSNLTVDEDHPRPRNTGEHFMVYATRNCIGYRNQVALALSRVGIIHHGNCVPKNCGLPLSRRRRRRHHGSLNISSVLEHYVASNRDHKLSLLLDGQEPKLKCNFTKLERVYQGHHQWPNNYQLFSHYRFCLVLENGFHPGYVTEKILYAFLGGCLPIWYGTTDVWNMFHRDSFLYVNVTDPTAVDQLVQHVQYLEENKTAYDEYFARDILANDKVLETYFSIDDAIGHGRLKHQIRVMMGLEDEQYFQLTPNVSKLILNDTDATTLEPSTSPIMSMQPKPSIPPTASVPAKPSIQPKVSVQHMPSFQPMLSVQPIMLNVSFGNQSGNNNTA